MTLLRRAARAFLALELQAGKSAPEEVKRVLEQGVVESPASPEQEVERYTYRAPGQAKQLLLRIHQVDALP
jgi:hypothetical protein